MHKIILMFSLLISSLAFANERIRPRAELLGEGYRPVMTGSLLRSLGTVAGEHSLPWPVAFQDPEHTVANSMAEFQPFGSPYFHGGCDLRTHAAADIHTPVAGRLEAGHYSYNNRDDGSLEKFWKPWPQTGETLYFEVAVITDDGTRYEFHHVDRSTLPQNIVDMLNNGGGRVEAGTLVGHVDYWPDGDYHHTHYNIVLPDGIRVNPEFVSPLLEDHMAPEILGAFALTQDSASVEFTGGALPKSTTEIVVDVQDRYNNSVYSHPPTYYSLKFASGPETKWDFRQKLSGSDGKFPPIWSFFMPNLTTNKGHSSSTEGGYGTGHSLVRLKVPAAASGPFILNIEDEAGNRSTLEGSL